MIFIGVAFGFFGGMLNVNPHVDGMLIATVTFAIAAMLIVIGLWMKPQTLAAFNLIAIVFLVLFGVSMILPRFDLTDTMRPWSAALVNMVPDEQIVTCITHALGGIRASYYRSGKAAPINSPEQMMALTASQPDLWCMCGQQSARRNREYRQRGYQDCAATGQSNRV